MGSTIFKNEGHFYLEVDTDPYRYISNVDQYLVLDPANGMKTDPEENVLKNQLLFIWT